jgi:putative transposase
MPRPRRKEYKGAHYHVMCRGNNGQEIFITDDGRRLYLQTLTEVCEQTGWRIHAYCLMSNHYHLLLETPAANLVDGMKWFQGTYTQRFNAMFMRRGHLFQGRYKAIPVQTDPLEGGLSYFRMLSTYIHLNPFRAKLVGEGCEQKLEVYPWSSYPAYVKRIRKTPTWLVKDKVYRTWDIAEDSRAGRAYKQKMERFMRFELDPDAGRRGEFEKQIKRGWYLGTKDFGVSVLNTLSTTKTPPKLEGAQKRLFAQEGAEELLRLALPQLGLSEEALLSLPNKQLEKQAIAWLLKSKTTVQVQWIADRMQMGHRTTASRAISKIRKANDRKTKSIRTKLLQITG